MGRAPVRWNLCLSLCLSLCIGVSIGIGGSVRSGVGIRHGGEPVAT